MARRSVLLPSLSPPIDVDGNHVGQGEGATHPGDVQSGDGRLALNNLNKSGVRWRPPVRTVYVPREPPPERSSPDSVRIKVLATGRPGIASSTGYRTPPAGLSSAEALAWAERAAAEERAKRRIG